MIPNIMQIDCFTCGKQVTVNVLKDAKRPCPHCGGSMCQVLTEAQHRDIHRTLDARRRN